MSTTEDLEDSNIELYATVNYKNKKCLSPEEFQSDFARFTYILKLIHKYNEGREINLRLLLNHIIIVFNTFEREASIKILKTKLNRAHYPVLKTILLFLNLLKESEFEDDGVNLTLAKQLREI